MTLTLQPQLLAYDSAVVCPASLELEIAYAHAVCSQSICFVTETLVNVTVHLTRLVLVYLQHQQQPLSPEATVCVQSPHVSCAALF